MRLKPDRLFLFVALLIPAAVMPMAHAGDVPWITTRGLGLVDSADHPVILQGVSLGGWLVEEMWMEPIATSPPPVRDCRLWRIMFRSPAWCSSGWGQPR